MIRLFIFNFVVACFLVWAWWVGFVHLITAADPFHVTYIIAAMFFAGVLYTFKRMRAVGFISSKKEGRIANILNMAVGDVVESLSMLGLVGSALGLLYAFSGIDQSSLASPQGMVGAMVNVLTGVKLLAGATLAASSSALFTIWNSRMLETAQLLKNEEFNEN